MSHVGESSAREQPDPTVGTLVHDLSQQVPELIRSELRLAQAEMAEKGKRAGVGLGLFSVSGLLAFFATACLLTGAILGLAHAVPDWLAAIIVAVVLLLVAGATAVIGKRNVEAATPPQPERAMEGLHEDIATVKGERA